MKNRQLGTPKWISNKRTKADRAERRAIKRQTSRFIRRKAKQDPETPAGIDTRSRVSGWHY